MKRAALLLTVGCVLSGAHAQWLETTLVVPDTFGRMLSPICLVYDSLDNTVYVGGDSCVIAIDGQTSRKVARIPTGPHVVALCYNPQNNRVYSANDSTNDVTVIDCATNAALTTLSVGERPVALCYNPQDNKVYCANAGSDNVTVIDGASNAIIATVSAGYLPSALCYNPQNSKVYCANDSSGNVTVIDGAGDSVITTVTVDTSERASLCYNSQDNKVYCASRLSGNVWVIDGATDSAIKTVSVGYQPSALCYNSVDNKVYCADAPYACVTVIDGAADSIIAVVTTSTNAEALCYNRQDDKVYVPDYPSGRVMVIDGATNSIVGSVMVGDNPVALCYNPQDSKVYCADRVDDGYGHRCGTVSVIDGVTNELVATVVTGDRPRALCYNLLNNKVYCANYASGSVTIVDGASNSIVSTVAVGAKTSALCYNPQNNMVYCGNEARNFVTVIDGATDQVVDSIGVGGGTDFLCYNRQNNKVYSHSGGFMAVIDCAVNQTIARVSVGGISALMYNPRRNAVYCAQSGSMSHPPGRIFVIDGATDSIVAVIDSTGSRNDVLCYSPMNDRLFCGSGVVIDCATNRTVDALPVGGGYGACFNLQNNRVYLTDSGRTVGVVDAASDSVVATVRLGTHPRALLYNATNNKVYCAHYDEMASGLTVIAGATNKVRKDLATGMNPHVLEWNPVQNRTYVANDLSSSITVLRDYMGPPLGDIDVDNDSLDVRADTIRLEGRGQYAVGEFVLANTSASYNPDPSDGPSQSPVDTFNVTGSLTGPGGTLDSILVSTLPESLVPGQAIVCTLSVYVPPGMQDSDYVGRIRISGRDTAGLVIEESFYALVPSRLGDLDVDNDSFSVKADTIRPRPQMVSVGPPPQYTEYALGEFVLANTDTSYNPDTTDGPSKSPVDSLRFTGSLTGPGGIIDSILIPNLPASLARGQTMVCTLRVYVPVGMSCGDYSGPVVLTGYDSRQYEVAETVHALVTKLGDIDIDGDSLGIDHETLDLHTQPAGPVYSPYAEARFMLVNTSSAYNPDAEDGPSRSKLEQVKVEGRNGTWDSVCVLNLPESLAVGQAVECTLALVLPIGATPDGYTGWITVSAVDTLGFSVQDSFFLTVHGPQPRQNLDSLRVAPIPFKPNQNPEHDAIHFQGLSSGARVIIYDASGQSVWSATEAGDGHLKWDAKVASGIYVYLVVSADGKSSKVGKLSVIR